MNQQNINDYGIHFLLKYNPYLENITKEQMHKIMLDSKRYDQNEFTRNIEEIFRPFTMDEIIFMIYQDEIIFNLIKFNDFNNSKDDLLQVISTTLFNNFTDISSKLTRKLFLLFNKYILNIDSNLNKVLPNNIMNNGESSAKLELNLGTLMFLIDYIDILPKRFNKDFSKYCEGIQLLSSKTERKINYRRYGL